MIDSTKLRVTMWKATPVNSKFAEELNRRKVFVKNLPTGFRFESVHKVLSRYGNPIDIDGVTSIADEKQRNIVIAIFETEEQARTCLQNQQIIKKE
jgi:RNA recognition motif-containing protein